jgi:uncharacterized membrane protein YfcA
MLEPSLLVVLLIIFIAMLVRSVAGFGDAIVALPLLSIFLGLTDSVALVTLTGFASALAIGLSSWSDINLACYWTVSAGLSHWRATWYWYAAQLTREVAFGWFGTVSLSVWGLQTEDTSNVTI